MEINNIQFGKIVEVSNSTITVKIDYVDNQPYKIVNGSPIRIGGVGNFIKVGNDIYEIINEKEVMESGDNVNPSIARSHRVLNCSVVGFFENGKYKQGSSGHTPNILESVYTVTNKELNAIYTSANPEKDIYVGKYLFNQDIDFYVDTNKFFASHTLIVGNTGSGKSNTLNLLYTQLFSLRDVKKSKFLIIDTNGEYSKAFTEEKSVKSLNTYSSSKNEIHIPLSFLSATDWKLLLEATEKTQYPIIKKLCNFLSKNIFNSTDQNNISEKIFEHYKNTIITILQSNATSSNKYAAIMNIKDELSYSTEPLYIEILKCIDSVFLGVSVNNSRLVCITSENVNSYYADVSETIIQKLRSSIIKTSKDSFNIDDFGYLLNNEHLARTYKYSSNEQNTSPLIARFNSNRRDFKNIFSPFIIGQTFDIFEELFGTNSILVCNVTKAKKDIRRIIVTFICSKLYEQYIANDERNKTSLHLIIDEAHNYLSSQNMEKEDAIAKICIETFESIIKEGRKFGVFLTMSTQRPSDITSTLLSQSHNYVIHKLVNPKDIEIIKNAVPFMDATSMKMLSILSPGQAIFTGTAFNRPNIVQVHFDESKTKVESDTVVFDKLWAIRTNVV